MKPYVTRHCKSLWTLFWDGRGETDRKTRMSSKKSARQQLKNDLTKNTQDEEI